MLCQRLLICALAFGFWVGCKDKTPAGGPYHVVRSTDLQVPELAGWTRDRSAEVDDATKDGILLRLVRPGAIPGSPRIDVVVTQDEAPALSVDNFLQKNLREMAALEAKGQIRITQVHQRPVAIGPRRAYRVRHEYMLGGSISITQVATLLVLDGRGVAVTAVGRTELFAPLADSIEKTLSGLSVATTTSAPVPKATAEPKKTQPGSSITTPIDLGKVGGN